MSTTLFSQKVVISTLVVVAVAVAAVVLIERSKIASFIFTPRESTAELGRSLSELQERVETATDSALTADPAGEAQEPVTVVDGLAVPWEVIPLADGSFLISERAGKVLHSTADQQRRVEVAGVRHVGEGGLLGMAVHPQFEQNNWLYLYLTTQTDSGLRNRIDRYTFDQSTNTLSAPKTIISDIPGARNHDGGRIAFGPDSLLYITTGDAEDSKLAQDTNSLAGKILRVTDEGGVPTDNPFGNPVYSYGHRNPQGIAWDSQGRLWESEHGPSGVETGYDEINLITKGSNYGWPQVKGDQTAEGMTPPILHSGSDDTWAPADLAIHNDFLYFSGLRGEGLYQARIAQSPASNPEVRLLNLTAHLRKDFGRIRAVVTGETGQLYITTSNTDGRGTARTGDDRLLQISPAALE